MGENKGIVVKKDVSPVCLTKNTEERLLGFQEPAEATKIVKNHMIGSLRREIRDPSPEEVENDEEE